MGAWRKHNTPLSLGIAEARAARKVTARAIYAMAGMNHATYGRMIGGQNPHPKLLPALADALARLCALPAEETYRLHADTYPGGEAPPPPPPPPEELPPSTLDDEEGEVRPRDRLRGDLAAAADAFAAVMSGRPWPGPGAGFARWSPFQRRLAVLLDALDRRAVRRVPGLPRPSLVLWRYVVDADARDFDLDPGRARLEDMALRLALRALLPHLDIADAARAA